jgi:hypothetical protein
MCVSLELLSLFKWRFVQVERYKVNQFCVCTQYKNMHKYTICGLSIPIRPVLSVSNACVWYVTGGGSPSYRRTELLGGQWGQYYSGLIEVSEHMYICVYIYIYIYIYI